MPYRAESFEILSGVIYVGGRLEHSIRYGLLRLLRRGDAPYRSKLSGSKGDAPQSILLIRTDRLGDAIITTPLIQHLRSIYPSARIDILLGEKNSVIGPLLPCIDRWRALSIRPLETLSILHELRSARYDLVLNLLLKPSATARSAALLAGGQRVISLDGPNQNGRRSSEHVVIATCRALSILGHPPPSHEPVAPEDKLCVRISDEALANGMRLIDADTPAVLVNISASHVDRRPGDEWYRALLTRLDHSGMHAYVTSLVADSRRANNLAENTRATVIPAVRDYAQFAGNVAASDVVITPDGSVVHLAAATGRPTVVLTRSLDTALQWGPWGVPSRTFAPDGPLESIPVEDVVIAAMSLIGTLD